MKQKIKSLINKYRTDGELKSRVRLYSGALLNIIFAVFKIFTGIIYRSSWLLAAGIYFFFPGSQDARHHAGPQDS